MTRPKPYRYWKKTVIRRAQDGIFAKDGKELSFTIINVGGNSDWVAAVQVIASELSPRRAGIKLTPDNLAYTDFTNELFTGKYQLAYNNEVGGPSPYYELRQLLYGPNSAPIGKLAAATNWERYIEPQHRQAHRRVRRHHLPQRCSTPSSTSSSRSC